MYVFEWQRAFHKKAERYLRRDIRLGRWRLPTIITADILRRQTKSCKDITNNWKSCSLKMLSMHFLPLRRAHWLLDFIFDCFRNLFNATRTDFIVQKPSCTIHEDDLINTKNIERLSAERRKTSMEAKLIRYQWILFSDACDARSSIKKRSLSCAMKFDIFASAIDSNWQLTSG